MFHQVFICNTEHEEEVITEPPFVKQDVIISGPEVKDESNEMILKTDDLNFEAKPCVKTELIQNMKLDLEPEPQLEEPSEILPDIRPMEDKEGLRRELSVEEYTKNVDFKRLSLVEGLKKDNLTKIVNIIECKPVLHLEKNVVKVLQSDEKQPEFGSNVSQAQNIKKCYVLLENCDGQSIKPNLSMCSDTEKNVNKTEDLFKADSCSKSKEVSSRSESDDEVPVPSDKETDSGSDWEQDHLRSLERYPSSRTLSTSETCEQTSSGKQQSCLKNILKKFVEEKTKSRSINNVNAESINEPITNSVPQEKASNTSKLPSTFYSYVEEVSVVFKVIGSDPDISVINESTFLCKLCNKVLENKRQLKYHVKRSFCRKNKDKPKKTARDETCEENTFFCTVCKKVFKTNQQYVYHTKYSLCYGYRRKAINQCDICGKAFSSASKLEDHQNSHTNARPHKCSECDKCFNSTLGRDTHFKNVHNKIKFIHLCSFCGITSKSISHMLAHEETHRLPEGSTIPKPFKCHQCGRGYISGFKLTNHLREHKKMKCSKCNEEFDTKSSLRKHKEEVHGIVKIFTCKTCGKTSKNSDSFRLHTLSHSTVLSFFCEICGKGFKQKHHIEQHMITHSDERPISCPDCDERFKRKTHLKQHMASAHGKGSKPTKSKTTV